VGHQHGVTCLDDAARDAFAQAKRNGVGRLAEESLDVRIGMVRGDRLERHPVVGKESDVATVPHEIGEPSGHEL
jgi:hypothetical protein